MGGFVVCTPSYVYFSLVQLNIQALPLVPFVSDSLGRRASLFLGSFILLGGVATQFAAPNVKVFIAARVIRKITSILIPFRLAR